MRARYHVALLTETLGQYFSSQALKCIIQANLGQDTPLNLLRPHLHFDNCWLAESLAYIETQHRLLIQAGDPARMWAAFGRLTHAAQDFYAHTNYVTLWLRLNGGVEKTCPAEMNGLDPALLNHPELRSCYFYLWRDFIYYVPGLKAFTKKYLVFPESHEAMHLDDESREPNFSYALAAARQRTQAEHQRAIRGLSAHQVEIFYGQ